MIRYVLILLILGSSFQVSAQDCVNNLINAMKAFEAGRLNEVPKLIDYDCINKNSALIKQDKVRFSRILVMSELYMRNRKGAELAMTHLLAADPKYVSGELDFPEFKRLMASFDREAVGGLEFSVGALVPIMNLKTIYTFSDELDDFQAPKYSSNTGLRVGVNYYKRVLPKIYVSSGLIYSSFSYTFEDSSFPAINIRMDESIQSISIPLGARYYMGEKIRLFADAGLQYDRLLKANAFLLRDEINNGIQLVNFDYDMMPFRQSSFFTGYLGAGLSFTTDGGIWEIGLRYTNAFKEFTMANESNYQLTRLFNYLENEVRLNSLSINVNYMINFYNPKLKD